MQFKEKDDKLQRGGGAGGGAVWHFSGHSAVFRRRSCFSSPRPLTGFYCSAGVKQEDGSGFLLLQDENSSGVFVEILIDKFL